MRAGRSSWEECERPARALVLLARLGAAWIGLAACGSLAGREPAGTPRGPAEAELLRTIARLEDARSSGAGMLERLVTHPRPAVRARAATALGRLGPRGRDDAATDALALALGDPDAGVRRAAAFACGLRGDAGIESAVLAHLADDDPLVRVRLVEAASRIATPKLQRALLAALDDPLAAVRAEAAQGAHRFPPGATAGAPSAEDVDRALIAAATRPGEESEVVWRALFSLSRRGARSAGPLFRATALDAGAARWSRFFAVKGLTSLAAAEGDGQRSPLASALERAAAEEDELLAGEALRGLAELADSGSLATLEACLARPSAHLRALACEALGGLDEAAPRARAAARAFAVDESPMVREAALVASAALHDPEAEARVFEASRASDPLSRHAAALAAAQLESASALPILTRLVADRSPFVTSAAIAALGAHPAAGSELLLELLLCEDNGYRLGAAQVLRDRGGVAAGIGRERLLRAWELAVGDGGAEARVELLRLAEVDDASDPSAHEQLLALALRDPESYVREVATRMGGGAGALLLEALPVRPPAAGDERSEEAWLAAAGPNPMVAVRTSRGEMLFELFPGEAPLHVHSFLQLAARGHFDGLGFHRVVPGFVIQGGCYRGDGNGGGDWRGASLRHEIGPRKYGRGSLGMPRWEDPDSGGSQFFVTHVPTPHLDGRYTIFGELRSGWEVLDSIEVGDVILSVDGR